jgi:hypothetical protein
MAAVFLIHTEKQDHKTGHTKEGIYFYFGNFFAIDNLLNSYKVGVCKKYWKIIEVYWKK